jgi:hypothetical protein
MVAGRCEAADGGAVEIRILVFQGRGVEQSPMAAWQRGAEE